VPRPRRSDTQLLWIVDIYGFLVAGSLITMSLHVGSDLLDAAGDAFTSALQATATTAAFVTLGAALLAAALLRQVRGATA
jgi:MFS transporter, DHA2 family, multidrug resistance protein